MKFAVTLALTATYAASFGLSFGSGLASGLQGSLGGSIQGQVGQFNQLSNHGQFGGYSSGISSKLGQAQFGLSTGGSAG